MEALGRQRETAGDPQCGEAEETVPATEESLGFTSSLSGADTNTS